MKTRHLYLVYDQQGINMVFFIGYAREKIEMYFSLLSQVSLFDMANHMRQLYPWLQGKIDKPGFYLTIKKGFKLMFSFYIDDHPDL